MMQNRWDEINFTLHLLYPTHFHLLHISSSLKVNNHLEKNKNLNKKNNSVKYFFFSPP